MGLFGDLTDAVKKRIEDPPKYRVKRVECTGCQGKGCWTCEKTGWLTVQEQIGGTNLFAAVQKTTESTRLTREFAPPTRGEMSEEKLAEMEEKIDRALKLNPDNFEANAIKGIIAASRGNLIASIRYLKKAETRQPKNTEVKELLSAAYLQAGRPKMSERKFAEAIALGVRKMNRKQTVREVAGGVVGGLLAGLIGVSLNE